VILKKIKIYIIFVKIIVIIEKIKMIFGCVTI